MFLHATPRVVIVGGGFAGMAAARQLKRSYDVTLVDPKKDFEFIPDLRGLVSRLKTPSVLRVPRQKILDDREQRFVQDAVTAIDPHHQTVRIGRGHVLRYDALILAPGLAPTFHGVPGAAQHALVMKDVESADRIGERLKALLDGGAPVEVTIVGGGYTGIEVLGEILRKYRRKSRLTVRLVEAGPRLLADRPDEVHRRVKKLAEEHDAEILTGAAVAEVEAERVTLASGASFRSDLTIWTTGGQAPAFMRDAGLIGAEGRWASAQATLRSLLHPEVFLAGDVAELFDPVLKQAANATSMGKRAGKNVRRMFDDKDLRAFEDHDPTHVIVTFGDLSAFMLDDDDTVIEAAELGAIRESLYRHGMIEVDDISRGPAAFRRLMKRLRVSTQRFARSRFEPAGGPRVWWDEERIDDPLLNTLHELLRRRRKSGPRRH